MDNELGDISMFCTCFSILRLPPREEQFQNLTCILMLHRFFFFLFDSIKVLPTLTRVQQACKAENRHRRNDLFSCIADFSH